MHCGREHYLYRYFSKSDLQDLFSVAEEGLNVSETSAQLQELHGSDRRYSKQLKAHLSRLSDIDFFLSTSDHSLLFNNDEVQQTGTISKAGEAPQLLNPPARSSCSLYRQRPGLPSALHCLRQQDFCPLC
jgi:hypothetical protein